MRPLNSIVCVFCGAVCYVMRSRCYLQNELHALSQLDDTTYYPNVDHYKTTIYHKVDEFFREHVKETLNEKESYIIDFFVAPDKVRRVIGEGKHETGTYMNPAVAVWWYI